MTDSLRIRPVLPDEAESIIQLWIEAFAESDPHGEVEDVQRVILDGRTARLLVATLDDKLAGTLIVAYDGWRGHLYRLAVLSPYRRRGIAGTLLREAESWLEARGCTRVRATVVAENTWATGFWDSAGYMADSMSYVRRLPRAR